MQDSGKSRIPELALTSLWRRRELPAYFSSDQYALLSSPYLAARLWHWPDSLEQRERKGSDFLPSLRVRQRKGRLYFTFTFLERERQGGTPYNHHRSISSTQPVLIFHQSRPPDTDTIARIKRIMEQPTQDRHGNIYEEGIDSYGDPKTIVYVNGGPGIIDVVKDREDIKKARVEQKRLADKYKDKGLEGK